jgi:hypothetical protein
MKEILTKMPQSAIVSNCVAFDPSWKMTFFYFHGQYNKSDCTQYLPSDLGQADYQNLYAIVFANKKEITSSDWRAKPLFQANILEQADGFTYLKPNTQDKTAIYVVENP